ncbi:hypothetical protein OCL06_12860 [Alteromonas sp. ASW11-19]|uniref:Uncharacterized protein n=1 Tax=Alteromonas salexigens TaxID=2982530 RepID=A0ABT2VUE4_9ALTE|nr:hypothetical protein [Alteromonas salexigens]MCU7555479.1 hypothetical protein [Alteromonas salexigens]
MIHRPQSLPGPLQALVHRALELCELMLPHCSAFYPFAALLEDDKVGCLFIDDSEHVENDTDLIEQLQWRIIDTTTDANSYSVLVYAATVKTDKHKQLDAIAITATYPDGRETLLLYPYFRVGNRIVLSPPIHG